MTDRPRWRALVPLRTPWPPFGASPGRTHAGPFWGPVRGGSGNSVQGAAGIPYARYHRQRRPCHRPRAVSQGQDRVGIVLIGHHVEVDLHPRPIVHGPTRAGSLSPSRVISTTQPSSSSFWMTRAVPPSPFHRFRPSRRDASGAPNRIPTGRHVSGPLTASWLATSLPLYSRREPAYACSSLCVRG